MGLRKLRVFGDLFRIEAILFLRKHKFNTICGPKLQDVCRKHATNSYSMTSSIPMSYWYRRNS